MPVAATTQRINQGAFEAKRPAYVSTSVNHQILKRMSDGQANKLPQQSTAAAMLYTALLMQAVASVPHKVLEQSARNAAATAMSNNKAVLHDAISNVAMQAARDSAVDVMARLTAGAFKMQGRLMREKKQAGVPGPLHPRARLPLHTTGKKAAGH